MWTLTALDSLEKKLKILNNQKHFPFREYIVNLWIPTSVGYPFNCMMLSVMVEVWNESELIFSFLPVFLKSKYVQIYVSLNYVFYLWQLWTAASSVNENVSALCCFFSSTTPSYCNERGNSKNKATGDERWTYTSQVLCAAIVKLIDLASC